MIPPTKSSEIGRRRSCPKAGPSGRRGGKSKARRGERLPDADARGGVDLVGDGGDGAGAGVEKRVPGEDETLSVEGSGIQGSAPPRRRARGAGLGEWG
jgi:hypothetical protein